MLGPAVVGLAELQEGLAAVLDDPRHRSQRLGVVEGGRLAIQAEACGERRLEARLPLLAFDRFEQCGFLAAEIGAVTMMRMQLEAELGTAQLITEVTGLARLLQRTLEDVLDLVDFAVDVV